MNRTCRPTGLALCLAGALAAEASAQPAPATMEAAAARLFQTLTEAQRQQATLPFDSPERRSEVFTGGKRPGIQLKTLSPQQRQMAVGLVTRFTSDHGLAKAKQIAGQDNDPEFGGHYLCFFGDPAKDRQWAWRVAEHHLTLVHVEVEEGRARTFGPILLGADPPTLWDDEEAVMIDLWAAMTSDERARAKLERRALSSEMLKPEQGVRVGELSEPARRKVQAVLDSRLRFFAPEIAERIRKIIASQGGVEALRLGFHGEATKRCREGGRWDFKLGGQGFLCDYENTRGHIHFAMKGTEEKG